MIILTASDSERFWAKATRGAPDECWLWTAGTNKGGYGRFGFEGRNWLAHRLLYCAEVRHVPSEIHLLHRCDVRRCINFHHLFEGDNVANNADMVAKGRARYVNGEAIGNSRWTAEVVLALRKRRAEGASYCRLVKEFRMPETTIFDMCKGRTWKHVGGLPCRPL